MHSTHQYRRPIFSLLFSIVSLMAINHQVLAGELLALQAHTPKILAHRGASGLWIQNSRHGVEESIQLFKKNPGMFHGIEVDIVLTKDHVPVLAHDPWVHKQLCHRRGEPASDGGLDDEVLIRALSWEALHSQFICGDRVDQDFPQAVGQAEPVVRLSEMLALVRQTPTLIVYLDTKIQPPLTLEAKHYAQAIAKDWREAGLSNPLYIEAPSAHALSFFEADPFADTGSRVKRVLAYPAFLANENWLLKGARRALYSYLFPKDALQQTDDASAQAVAMPTQVLNRASRRYLQEGNKAVIVFTPNDTQSFQAACESGVDIIITDYPTLGPCPANP